MSELKLRPPAKLHQPTIGHYLELHLTAAVTAGPRRATVAAATSKMVRDNEFIPARHVN
jgi:hypothetical protein